MRGKEQIHRDTEADGRRKGPGAATFVINKK
jgi:hypothetical protein